MAQRVERCGSMRHVPASRGVTALSAKKCSNRRGSQSRRAGKRPGEEADVAAVLGLLEQDVGAHFVAAAAATRPERTDRCAR